MGSAQTALAGCGGVGCGGGKTLPAALGLMDRMAVGDGEKVKRALSEWLRSCWPECDCFWMLAQGPRAVEMRQHTRYQELGSFQGQLLGIIR